MRRENDCMCYYSNFIYVLQIYIYLQCLFPKRFSGTAMKKQQNNYFPI